MNDGNVRIEYKTAMMKSGNYTPTSTKLRLAQIYMGLTHYKLFI